MGMFDEIRSSYPLPDEFMKLNHTKEIDDFGGSLSNYWIAPDGYLWVGDYTGCHTFEVYREDDPRYDPKFKWNNWEWIPTGTHGKWRVHPITRYCTLYPAEWSGSWESWPRLRVHFRSGRLIDFTDITEQ